MRFSAPAEQFFDAAKPLAGKTVVVLHAAWHSCGSYQINTTQARAYKALGARVISWAVREWPPGRADAQDPWWADYIARTADMPADARAYSNMPRAIWARPKFWREVYWPLVHGDHARATSAMIDLAPLPPSLMRERVDLVHCNHFFCLPAARKLQGAQIICETQDVQARQYDLRNEGRFLIPPRARYEAMLETELKILRDADVLIHLNESEYFEFQKLAPDLRHEFIYPAVESVATGPGGPDAVIVASGNLPNVLSVIWFLEEVAPKVGLDLAGRVKIAGNVDQAVAARAPELYARWRDLFLGRVADINAVYAAAAVVLLPTIEGHGLSIKAVEALASGAPLIAAPAAFRGMRADPAAMSNVALCAESDAFAAALRENLTQERDGRTHADAREKSPTRALWLEEFSPQAYASKLARLVASLRGV